MLTTFFLLDDVFALFVCLIHISLKKISKKDPSPHKTRDCFIRQLQSEKLFYTLKGNRL